MENFLNRNLRWLIHHALNAQDLLLISSSKTTYVNRLPVRLHIPVGLNQQRKIIEAKNERQMKKLFPPHNFSVFFTEVVDPRMWSH